MYNDFKSATYSRFLSANPPATTAITANPLTSQTEIPVSARILEGFSGFLLEADDDVVVAAVEAPEDEELVDEVAVPLAPEPVPPGVTDGGVGRVARR